MNRYFSIATLALSKYTLLEPLPLDLTNGSVPVTEVDPGQYLSNIFTLIIAIALVIAVFRLMYAGIIYISTSVSSQKGNAKQIIQDTMMGLGLALGAWLIIATVNPKALDISLTLPSVAPAENTNQGTGGTGGSGGGSGGLQQITINAVSGLRQECNCSVRITSTTGDSHDPNSLHFQGLAVDIGADSNLTKYLTGQTANPQACSTYNKTLNGVSARFLWEPTGSHCGGLVASTADHWHMSVLK